MGESFTTLALIRYAPIMLHYPTLWKYHRFAHMIIMFACTKRIWLLRARSGLLLGLVLAVLGSKLLSPHRQREIVPLRPLMLRVLLLHLFNSAAPRQLLALSGV